MYADIFDELDIQPMSKEDKKRWEEIYAEIRRKAPEWEKQKRIDAAKARIAAEKLIIG